MIRSFNLINEKSRIKSMNIVFGIAFRVKKWGKIYLGNNICTYFLIIVAKFYGINFLCLCKIIDLVFYNEQEKEFIYKCTYMSSIFVCLFYLIFCDFHITFFYIYLGTYAADTYRPMQSKLS